MKNKRTVLRVSAILLIGLFVSVRLSLAQSHPRSSEAQAMIHSLQDSVRILRLDVDSLKQQAPDLGDYMTTFQLHIAKLWFAFAAVNWDLAAYEVHELDETMDGAKALHVFKNNVNTASVIQSVQETQILLLKNAVAAKDHQLFSSAYNQTLETCNACHRSAGYGFISITLPTTPPVSNQQWDAH
ncbi:MAG TPA: hypothetical protein VMM58_00580 [Bacteroidota bacterium]|nr:hypothetical protein [Bacteroidota bacterium]